MKTMTKKNKVKNMGDRVSIQFEMDGKKSVGFFSHWRGKNLVKSLKKYAKDIGKPTTTNRMTPFDRREPNTIMVDFLRLYLKGEDRVTSDPYLSPNPAEYGDNSDNGNWVCNLATLEVTRK